MPLLKTEPPTVQAVLERITQELTDFISDEMQRRIVEALRPGMKMPSPARSQLKTVRRDRGLNPGGETKTARARPKPPAVERKPPTTVTAGPVDRRPAFNERRVLDMTCRVEGCGRRSRGPRMGFICDLHRAQLTPEQQVRARENYKARAKAPASARIAVPTIALAPVDDARPAVSLAVVAPSAQASDAVALPTGSGPAPAGSDYVLTIDRARLVTPQKLGPTVELRFTVARGPQRGRVARGRFPVSGRGLAVLIDTALGEPVNASDPDVLIRLVGKTVSADVVSSGNPDGSLAIVRNIRFFGGDTR